MLSHIALEHSAQVGAEIPKEGRPRKYVVKTNRRELQALNRRLTQKYFDFQIVDEVPRKLQCIGEALDLSRYNIVKPHIRKFRREIGNIKFMLHLKARMVKTFSQDGQSEIKWFNSNNIEIEGLHQFNQVFNTMAAQIWEQFETFSNHGSGYHIDEILGITVSTCSYNPLRIGCSHHIPVPLQIRNSKAVVNIKSGSQQDCFKNAITCSAFYKEIKEKQKTNESLSPCRASTYRKLKLFERLNFNQIQFPIKPSEKLYLTWEKNNPEYAINITRLKTYGSREQEVKGREKINVRKVLNICPQRTSPHRHRIQLHLLNLYNPRTKHSHFVSVTNLDNLLSHCSSAKPSRRFKMCWQCKYPFRGKNFQLNYEKHLKFCGGEKVSYSANLSRTNGFKTMFAETSDSVTRCTNCFQFYEGGKREQREKQMQQHMIHCTTKPPAIINFPPENSISFKSYRKRRYVPFSIVADTESLLVSDEVKADIQEQIRKCKSELKKNTNCDDEVDDETNDGDDGEEMEGFDDFDDGEEEEEDEGGDNRQDVEFDQSSLPPQPSDENVVLHNHEQSSFSFQVITLPHLQKHFPLPVTYRGIDAGLVFFKKLKEAQQEIAKLWNSERKKFKTCPTLTPSEQRHYDRTSHCHICKYEITSTEDLESFKEENLRVKTLRWMRTKNPIEKGPKVRDHSHWNGQFIGKYVVIFST